MEVVSTEMFVHRKGQDEPSQTFARRHPPYRLNSAQLVDEVAFSTQADILRGGL